MKKFLVIGNPIEHSLSPKLHNYWLKINNIKGIYEKKLLTEVELNSIVAMIRNEKLVGVNITVPFKNKIIQHLDILTEDAKITQSVNTIFKKDGKIFGSNTDTLGFELSLSKFTEYLKDKKVLILGAGGVVPSIIYALKKLKVSKIYVSNRTIKKSEKIKLLFKDIEIIEWGETPTVDIIINGTSLGLKRDDKLAIDYQKIGQNKLFYDVIYSPPKTNFLKEAENKGNLIQNGKLMFVYQAQKAFEIWNNIKPDINDEVLNFLND